MELIGVDTQQAYGVIRKKITTLDLAPGAQINEQELAAELRMAQKPVTEALKLLVHDHLVVITPRHGLYVADVSMPDLDQLSELRLSLETFAARLAAERASADDLAVLESIRLEQASADPTDARLLFEIDHRFHTSIAHASRNKYLAQTLDQLFGLSQRLWFLALPHLSHLSVAVERHLALIEAVRQHDSAGAEEIMRTHVADFYASVREVIAKRGG